MTLARNVLGGELLPCSYDPLTGFYRDGCCETGPDDHGTHVVCSRVTAAFLDFSREHGNDLSTPRPEWRFIGLQPGDRWRILALGACGYYLASLFDFLGLAIDIAGIARHEPAPGKYQNGSRLQLIRHHHRAPHHFLPGCAPAARSLHGEL